VIKHEVFYDRLNNHCKQCEWWKNVCLKGHGLASPQGCPLQKFPPVDGAGYAPDIPPQKPTVLVSGCCEDAAEMPPLTWGQVLLKFTMSMATWIKAGLPMATIDHHGERYGQCKSCDEFNRFYCKQCKCIAYLKTKLLTEQCPKQPPRWV
jgi:hypothetical protein